MTSPDLRRSRRTLGAYAVPAAVVAWWPAFTLGVWDGLFFEQILALWAAATAGFIVLLFRGEPRRPRIVTATLLLPSLWIALSFLPLEDGTPLSEVITWFGVGITVAGLPFMVWVMLQLAQPDIVEVVSGRTWLRVAAAVAGVAVLSFALGVLHPYYLTCDDFSISGNEPPPNCTVGDASLEPERAPWAGEHRQS